MVKFHSLIRPTQIRQDGTVNIKICVTHNRKAGYLPTDHYIFSKEMEPDGKINALYRSYDDAQEINMSVMAQMGGYAQRVNDNKEKVKKFTLPELMLFLKQKDDPTDLVTVLKEKVERYKKAKNRGYEKSYLGTINMLEKKLGFKSIPLSKVTGAWLTTQDEEMRDLGFAQNSIIHHMTNIRTAYGYAIKKGLIDVEYSKLPFKIYEMPAREETPYRNIPAVEIAKIARLEISAPLVAWARDIFMLSFYLFGINMVDLAKLQRIDKGRIRYKRSKKGALYNIKVEPEAQAIIDRYPGKKALLNIMDNYADYTSATKRVNIKLKDIATHCKIDLGDEKLTTYVARHSLVTISGKAELKINLEVIDNAMWPKKNIAAIYRERDMTLQDQANRTIIDYINNYFIPKEEEVPAFTPPPQLSKKIRKARKPKKPHA